MDHATDAGLLNRLKRANGHLVTIIRMIEENRNGLEVALDVERLDDLEVLQV